MLVPPPPSSNRTGGFPASGFPESLVIKACTRCYPCLALRLRFPGRTEAFRGSRRIFRCGTGVQADLLTFRKTRIRQGSFAPRELPRFPATMPPSDSRTGPNGGYLFPTPVASPLIRAGYPNGSPRFLDGSLDIRRPLSPRRVRPPLLLVTSRSMAGFARLGRLATLKLRL